MKLLTTDDVEIIVAELREPIPDRTQMVDVPGVLRGRLERARNMGASTELVDLCAILLDFSCKLGGRVPPGRGV